MAHSRTAICGRAECVVSCSTTWRTRLVEDEDALREMRLAYVIHKAAGFEIRMGRADLLRFAFENGRFAVTGTRDGGRIAPGAPADLLVLDWKKLSAELIEQDVPAIELLLAKGSDLSELAGAI